MRISDWSSDVCSSDLWQWSAEAAFNRLGNVARLYTLDPAGDFVELPFPEGTGGVSEDRYESMLSFGRTLAPHLSVQLVGGAGYSTLTQPVLNGLERRSFRRREALLVGEEGVRSFRSQRIPYQ